eukprot:CFRG2820T1
MRSFIVAINRDLTYTENLLEENNITTAKQLVFTLGVLRAQISFYLANTTDPAVIERLKLLPSVLGIERAEPIVLPDNPNPDGQNSSQVLDVDEDEGRRRALIGASCTGCCQQSTDVVDLPGIDLYNLERLNHGFNSYNGVYNYSVPVDETEPSVDVYVFDSGITLTHSDFEGRAYYGLDTINEFNKGDNNGHGTHVAGIVGGKTFGVVKNVNLISVKVLNADGAGSTANIMIGMTWLYSVVSRQNPRRPTIINLSLGGEFSQTMNDYVATMAKIGILVVTAAGNSASLACNESPASAVASISVGSSGRSDIISSFSNFGSCVDIIAPGEDILSASYTGTGALVKSGTSQACPLVAGLAALVWQNDTSQTIQEIANYIKATGNTNLIGSLPDDTVNLLAHKNECGELNVNAAVRSSSILVVMQLLVAVVSISRFM